MKLSQFQLLCFTVALQAFLIGGVATGALAKRPAQATTCIK